MIMIYEFKFSKMCASLVSLQLARTEYDILKHNDRRESTIAHSTIMIAIIDAFSETRDRLKQNFISI